MAVTRGIVDALLLSHLPALTRLTERRTVGDIVAEMLNEVVTRAVTAISKTGPAPDSAATRRRGIRSQERLVELIEAGKAAEAESGLRAAVYNSDGKPEHAALHLQAKGLLELVQNARKETSKANAS